MKCPNCNVNEARIDPILGIIPCTPCASRPHSVAHKQIEFVSEQIKEQRKIFAKDILQPHRKGQLSKEYVETYGAKAAVDRGFSAKEIQNAKYVWGDLTYYQNV
jgi:hypothetical protein